MNTWKILFYDPVRFMTKDMKRIEEKVPVITIPDYQNGSKSPYIIDTGIEAKIDNEK